MASSRCMDAASSGHVFSFSLLQYKHLQSHTNRTIGALTLMKRVAKSI
ncbi:MAG: hypothetical protein U0525_00065 [Patescibacteria group bacterium]